MFSEQYAMWHGLDNDFYPPDDERFESAVNDIFVRAGIACLSLSEKPLPAQALAAQASPAQASTAEASTAEASPAQASPAELLKRGLEGEEGGVQTRAQLRLLSKRAGGDAKAQLAAKGSKRAKRVRVEEGAKEAEEDSKEVEEGGGGFDPHDWVTNKATVISLLEAMFVITRTSRALQIVDTELTDAVEALRKTLEQRQYFPSPPSYNPFGC